MENKLKKDLLELEYLEQYDPKNRFDMLPQYWNDIDDDELKIKLLQTAIKEKKTLFDIPGVELFIEGVYA